jgi:hypothetical protein
VISSILYETAWEKIVRGPCSRGMDHTFSKVHTATTAPLVVSRVSGPRIDRSLRVSRLSICQVYGYCVQNWRIGISRPNYSRDTRIFELLLRSQRLYRLETNLFAFIHLNSDMADISIVCPFDLPNCERVTVISVVRGLLLGRILKRTRRTPALPILALIPMACLEI